MKFHSAKIRRTKAHVSTLGTTQMHLRNPLVIAWWSAAFPGLGHLLLSKYLRGFLLFIWEVIINLKANINTAILYSFNGRFDEAKEILNTEWMLLYIPTYIFAIWDSYRTTVDLNQQYILAAREDAEIKPFRMNALGINYLDKRKPWVAFVWSVFMPGTGQVYINRIITAFFILAWWIVISHQAHLLPAIHYTFLGRFAEATAVTNAQWLLNMPSIYLFSAYDAYANAVENNKLYEWEQVKFLKKHYQNNNFPMPSLYNRGAKLYIISTFEHSQNLELALTAIVAKGIAKDKILTVSMDKKIEKIQLLDTIHHSDGVSLLDLPCIFGMVFMLLGSIYGFVLTWGPILWALIGLLLGFCLGLAIKLISLKRYPGRQHKGKLPEVVMIIECETNLLKTVKDILWSHHALGVSKLSLGN